MAPVRAIWAIVGSTRPCARAVAEPDAAPTATTILTAPFVPTPRASAEQEDEPTVATMVTPGLLAAEAPDAVPAEEATAVPCPVVETAPEAAPIAPTTVTVVA